MNEAEKYVLDLKKHWEVFLNIFLYLLQIKYPDGTIYTQQDKELGLLYITLQVNKDDDTFRQQIRYNTFYGAFSSHISDKNTNVIEFAIKEVHEFDRLFKYRIKEKENFNEYVRSGS